MMKKFKHSLIIVLCSIKINLPYFKMYFISYQDEFTFKEICSFFLTFLNLYLIHFYLFINIHSKYLEIILI